MLVASIKGIGNNNKLAYIYDYIVYCIGFPVNNTGIGVQQNS